MSNYWAIAIGINQYQNFGSLLYAQWDAQALWNYWVKEAGIPINQCVLLTDNVLPGATTSIIPTKDTIQQQLIELGHHRLGVDDTLWCFFSGYGVHEQGQDYLVPLDGDPNNLSQTSIAASAFFAALNAFPTQRIVVLLDLKRLPDRLGPEVRLGDDIERQAQQFGIPTLLASKPDQLSHETLTLRQGLFTATLLDALRTHGCFRLDQLVKYVEHRLPELSDYHWRRPTQEPLVVLPSAQKQLVLLGQPFGQSSDGPESGLAGVGVAADGVTADGVTARGALRSPTATAPSPSSPGSGAVPAADAETGAMAGATTGSQVQRPPIGQELSYKPQPSTSTVKSVLPEELEYPPTSPTPSPSPEQPPVPPDADDPELIEIEDEDETNEFWSQCLQYGLPLLALVMLVVLKLNWPAFTKQTSSSSTTGVGTTTPTAPTDGPNGTVDGTSDGLPGNLTGKGDGAIAPPESSFPLPDAANPLPPADALERAKASMAAGEYEDALLWLDQVPPEAQTQDYADLRVEAESSRSQSGQTNRAILDEAIASLNQAREETDVNQASDFGRAIAIANRIQPGQPLYDNAQEYIQRWGQVILDLAEARAQSGDYEEAIAAASLIEDDFPLLYQKSQALVKGWQGNVDTKTDNQAIIDAAKASIRPDQASSYNRAIGRLRTIEAGQPNYDQAQQLIDDYSKEILDIANWRAKKGEYYSAIDAASLVPPEVPVYLEAQASIVEWRRLLGGG